MEQQWIAPDVKGVIANPIHVGLGPYLQLVSDSTWITAFRKLMQEVGEEEALVLMLGQLRESFQDL